MFNIGDLVHHKRNDISFGLGVIVKISDRTAIFAQINTLNCAAIPENLMVYAYHIHFVGGPKHGFSDSIPKRWILEQDIELVSEAKTNV